MIKRHGGLIVTVVVVAAFILLSQVVDSKPSEACIKEMSDYLNQQSIPDSVKELMDESSKVCPDYMDLFQWGDYGLKVYHKLMRWFGYPDECDEIIHHFNRLFTAVTCLGDLSNAEMALATSDEAARYFLASEYACAIQSV